MMNFVLRYNQHHIYPEIDNYQSQLGQILIILNCLLANKKSPKL